MPGTLKKVEAWSGWLAFIASLAMVVPLLGSLSLLLPWHVIRGGAESGPRLVPYLQDGDLRARMTTYGRPCKSGSECESPLACLLDLRHGESYCTASNCLSDAQCRDDFACRPMLSRDDTALLYLCTPVGVRKQGEPCRGMPDSKEKACERGLRCNSYGRCGSPCEPKEPQSCPEGFVCKEDPEGATCLPSCNARQCPEGQHCIQLQPPMSLCARVEGMNCNQTPCPSGQRCRIGFRTTEPDVVDMGCETVCTPGGNECPEGMYCLISTCFRTCDPRVPDSCGPGGECAQFFTDAPWLCRDRR